MDQRMQEYIAARILADPRERICALLGADGLPQLAQKKKPAQGCGVLSDRAVYLNGPGYLERKGRFHRAELDHEIPLSSVTGVRRVRKNAVLLLTLSLFFLILAPTLLLLNAALDYGAKTVLSPKLDCAVCVLLAGALLIWHSIRSRRLFEIRYAAGGLALDVRSLSREEEQHFTRELHSLLQSESETDRQGEKAAPRDSPGTRLFCVRYFFSISRIVRNWVS